MNVQTTMAGWLWYCSKLKDVRMAVLKCLLWTEAAQEPVTQSHLILLCYTDKRQRFCFSPVGFSLHIPLKKILNNIPVTFITSSEGRTRTEHENSSSNNTQHLFSSTVSLIPRKCVRWDFIVHIWWNLQTLSYPNSLKTTGLGPATWGHAAV